MSENKYPIGGYAPGEEIPAVDHDQAHINMDAGMPDFEAYYQAGFSNGHDIGYSKAQREFEKAPKPAGAMWPLFVVDKVTGERHEVNKIVYHPENEPEPHIWCDTWYGHHVIGKDCEWAMNETPTPNHDQITAALRKFISMHETGLLPNRFTYEEGKKALEG